MATKAKTKARALDKDGRRDKAEWTVIEKITVTLAALFAFIRSAHEDLSKAREALSDVESFVRGLSASQSNTSASSAGPFETAVIVGTGMDSGVRSRARLDKSKPRYGKKAGTSLRSRRVE